MKKRFSGPQIVAKLRQADVLISQGKTVPEVCKEIEISQKKRNSYLFMRTYTFYLALQRDHIEKARKANKEGLGGNIGRYYFYLAIIIKYSTACPFFT
jgi:hypothetical protein